MQSRISPFHVLPMVTIYVGIHGHQAYERSLPSGKPLVPMIYVTIQNTYVILTFHKVQQNI